MNRVGPYQIKKRIMYGTFWILCALVYIIVPLQHLDAYAYDYDEGPYLQAAALSSYGYSLYSDVVLNKLPFATWLLQVSFAVLGVTLANARITMLILNLIGFMCLGLIAESWWGEGAGPVTMLVYLTISEAVTRSIVVMVDIPAYALALASLAAATRFRQRNGWLWVFISAIAFVLSLGFHPILFFLGIPLSWIYIAPKRRSGIDVRTTVKLLKTFILFGLIIFIIMISLVDVQGLLRWVYSYNATAAQETIHLYSWSRIIDYLIAHWKLLSLVTLGLVPLIVSRKRLGLSTSIIWMYLSLITLGFYRPLWEHYLIFLLYPCVLIAGGGIISMFKWVISCKMKYSTLWRWSFALLTLLLFGGLVSQRVYCPPDWPVPPANGTAATDYLLQLTGQKKDFTKGAFIITDNQFFAFTHGFFVPPALTDTSFKRIRNGYLSIGDITSDVLAHKINAILLDFEHGRLFHFSDMLKGIEIISESPSCFVKLCVYPVSQYIQTDALIGNSIRLVAHSIPEHAVLNAGDNMTVTLYWESISPISEDWTVFVHVFDKEGEMVAQHDAPPFLGTAPTQTWNVGNIIPDPHLLTVENKEPGEYIVAVGMYRQSTLERVPAFDMDGVRWLNDVIILASVHIE